MARHLNAKCRMCRREGVKLFLKGERCFSPKCPIEKKGAQPPGQHGPKRKRKISDFGAQLREKQKVKRMYQVLERQFRRYFEKVAKKREGVGERLLQTLETRLDNVIYRLGFVPSRSMARQLVSHGHVFVDGKKVDIPSFLVKPGQVISISSRALAFPFVQKSLAEEDRPVPGWLEKKAAAGKVIRLPQREEIESGINENLIVEFYSR